MYNADIKRYALEEFNSAVPQLKALPVTESLMRFYRRLDDALSTATSALSQPLACKDGCDLCCHYKIEVMPAEVLTVQQHVVRHFKPEQLQRVMTQARLNVAQAKGLSRQAQSILNQRCPFLLDHRCSIYEVRPSPCRTHHAADVKVCEDSFRQPEADFPKIHVKSIEDAGAGTASGFVQAMAASGMDQKVYDFSSAFLEAMATPALAQRIKSGKKGFVKVKPADAE